MSLYGQVECEMNDIERLKAAIEAAGLGDRVKVYPEGNGVYRAYSGRPGSAGGSIRGRDAHVVIHGGLDNSGRYRPSAPEVGGSGDTAFIINADGSVRVEIDKKWHNAGHNWELVQNYYALHDSIARYKAMGCKVELQVDETTGKMVGKVIQTRPTASRTTARRGATAQRPRAVRG